MSGCLRKPRESRGTRSITRTHLRVAGQDSLEYWVRRLAEHGRVTLRGTTRSSAVAGLIEGVQNIPGVHDVINRMKAEETAG